MKNKKYDAGECSAMIQYKEAWLVQERVTVQDPCRIRSTSFSSREPIFMIVFCIG